MTTTRYPMDVNDLNKGDYISLEDCELILNKKRDDDPDKYRLALLGLKDLIVRELTRSGRVLTVNIHHDGIRICTDSEAAEYNRSRFALSVRSMTEATIRNQHVDDAELTEEQRAAHRQELAKMAAVTSATIGALKTCRLGASAHRRLGAVPATSGADALREGGKVQ